MCEVMSQAKEASSFEGKQLPCSNNNITSTLNMNDGLLPLLRQQQQQQQQESEGSESEEVDIDGEEEEESMPHPESSSPNIGNVFSQSTPAEVGSFLSAFKVSSSAENPSYLTPNRSWHPHVYRPPLRGPTPHSVADILGWNRLPYEEPLNLTTKQLDEHKLYNSKGKNKFPSCSRRD